MKSSIAYNVFCGIGAFFSVTTLAFTLQEFAHWIERKRNGRNPR